MWNELNLFDWPLTWEHMVTLVPPVFEKVVRPIIVYVALLVGLRVAGKRELAQLNAMDLIVLLLLSNTVQNAIIGPDDSLVGGLIGAVALLGANYFVVRFGFSHPKFDALVEGRPVVLIDHGTVNRKKMQYELITQHELTAAAHRQGFASLKQVDRAVLEPSGIMTFVGKEPVPEELRHTELMRRVNEIGKQLEEIQDALKRRG